MMALGDGSPALLNEIPSFVPKLQKLATRHGVLGANGNRDASGCSGVCHRSRPMQVAAQLLEDAVLHLNVTQSDS